MGVLGGAVTFLLLLALCRDQLVRGPGRLLIREIFHVVLFRSLFWSTTMGSSTILGWWLDRSPMKCQTNTRFDRGRIGALPTKENPRQTPNSTRMVRSILFLEPKMRPLSWFS